MEQKFDAIVVGAGPAGCACAYKLAQSNLQVLVIERGKFAGAKNTWGGAYFGPLLGELFPGFWEEAPFERYVSHHKFSAFTAESALSLDFTSAKHSHVPYNAVTILRSKFDRWLAQKVEQAGAIVATGLQADDLIWNEGKVAGIKAGNDQIPADVVIACDGVNSQLAQKARLRDELAPEDIKQGAKEVIALPREVIEQRFNLKGDEGTAWEFVGSCTRGIPGGGFIYTNKDSLSIGIVVQLKDLVHSKMNINELLEDFKHHPAVSPLLEGGKLVEYSAHLIPTSGLKMIPKLYTDGMLVAGDAAAFVVGTGLVLEGANFAVASGIAAAETVLKARQKEDFSAGTLSYYQELLEESFVLHDLKTFKDAPAFLKNQRIYTTYPDLMCDFAEKLFTHDGKPRKKVWDQFKEAIKGKISLTQLAGDLWKAKGAI
jgi:electron transfer flavoprotein-quinone oxidoreductase